MNNESEPFPWLLVITINIVVALFFGSIVFYFAKKRNRNPWPWAIAGGIFPQLTAVPTLIALFATSPRCGSCKIPLNKVEWKEKRCPKCGWSGQGTAR